MKSKGLASILDKQFIGTDKLRKNLTNILKKIGKKKALIVTQSGRPQAVLLDFKTYLTLTETSSETPNTIGLEKKSIFQENKRGQLAGSATIFSFHPSKPHADEGP